MPNPVAEKKKKIVQQILVFTSDLVAPPIMKTKMRCPVFLESPGAVIKTESLEEKCQHKLCIGG